MPLLLPQQRYPQERGLAPEEPAGCPECLSRHCFANNRTYSAVARWSFSYSGEEHVPAACQLTLGCAGTRNENPDKGSDYITQAPSSTTRPAGQLRRPSDAISLAKSAFLPGDHVQTFSFEPTARTPSSGFRNLTRMLPITAQSQSRLKRPDSAVNFVESTRVQLKSHPPAATDKCNRHRPVWQRPAVAHRRRTGMPARIVSGPSANACMAIMPAHARGKMLLP